MKHSHTLFPIALVGALGVLGCAGGRARQSAPSPQPQPASRDQTEVERAAPVLPPHVAYLAGLMPLRSTGVDSFRVTQPTADGRGVLIAILDSGIDPGLPGLQTTTTGETKILDLRDFSGEGRIALQPITPDASGVVVIDGHRLTGFGRVLGLSAGPFYGGVLRELTLGNAPEADVNGNGEATDQLPIVVAKSSGGWFVMTDRDGDGSLEDDQPVRDYLVAHETLTYGTAPITMAVNLEELGGRPVLDLLFDNAGHGSHVSGIAAGHNLFGVEGFDGVAPGAQLLGLKISNNARGGISVTGSMLRAMNYAADVAARRNMPLVLNLSFGVGNQIEGSASIDSIVDEFALKHPDALFVISAGNDGPGLSTMGFPGSAEYALTVCALYPGVFVRAPVPGVPPAPDAIGWWSARGGELAKPDLCAPGIAFSNVPPWRAGDEISGGTSMAAPHVSGMAALLLSGALYEGRRVRGVELKQALISTAQPVKGGTVLDEGTGVPNVGRAFRWLEASHQAGLYDITALAPGGQHTGATAAYRRDGLAGPADTTQRFVIRSVAGQPAARLLLRPDVPWLHAPPAIEPRGAPATVTVTYDAAALATPGEHTGTVWAVPATDTMSGPSFGLINTIVVPEDASQAVTDEGSVSPGDVTRTFLAVRPGAAGLDVRLRVNGRQARATLHLFEPGGQPYRGGGEAAATGADPGRIAVEADDLVPGVYEAVVAAPPDGGARYTLDASTPTVAIGPIGESSVTIRNVASDAQSATVTPELLGAVRSYDVRGTRGAPQVLTTAVPPWASAIMVDVQLPDALWQTMTDFGVTVFDAQGHKIADGPLHYAIGRMEVPWDSTMAPDTVAIELFPAYAHLEPAEEWTAHVVLGFELSDPSALKIAGQSAMAHYSLAAGEQQVVEFTLPGEFRALPTGFDPWVEVRTVDQSGWIARRRGPVAHQLPAAREDGQ